MQEGSQRTVEDAMKESGPILIAAILRATIEHVHESPAIDPTHPGILEFERVLNEQIRRFTAKQSVGAAWNLPTGH